MKKRFLLSLMLGAFALSGVAQDDMYFVPSKRNNERVQSVQVVPSGTYHSGSMRSVDDYNRRWASSYEVLPADTSDIVSFSAVEGVYPDSLGDFALTQRMTRFDGYEPSLAYWEGYAQGRRDYIGWHSPWYYSSYYPWYDSWYYDRWYWDSWYWDPWYYRPWGWGGYYSYYYPYYGYGWGWGGGGYIGHINRSTENHGRIIGASPRTYALGGRGSGFGGSRRGSFGGTRAGSYGSTGGSGAFGGSRTGSFGGSRSGGSYGNTGSGSFGGSRSTGSFGGSRTTRPVTGSSNSGSTYSGSSSSSSSSSGSFGGSRSSGSSGGGSFGGSRSSGGGGGGGRSGGGGFGGSRR